MNTEVKLTYEQKKQLRQLYGTYKDIDRNEYDGDVEQYRADRAELKKDLDTLMAICGLPENVDIEEYIYSDNQRLFIEDAQQGYGKLFYGYSGRGMFGDCCPSLYCYSHNDITTKAKTQIDGMGLGIVIYAQS